MENDSSSARHHRLFRYPFIEKNRLRDGAHSARSQIGIALDFDGPTVRTVSGALKIRSIYE
jgi:hypothetical protein